MIRKTSLAALSLFVVSSVGFKNTAKSAVPRRNGPTRAGRKNTSESQPGMAGQATEAGTPPGDGKGPTCKTDDPNRLCLAVKYVAYKEGDKAVVTAEEAAQNIEKINKLWAQCNIGFQIEQYMDPVAKDVGLRNNTANYDELADVRKALSDDKTLLLVTTGEWDRSGTLGSTGANAWANLPGEGLYGVVMEEPVGKFGNIIAHELGHYLGLSHENDTSNLLNPVIYNESTNLSKEQCDTARKAASEDWKNMLR